MKGFLKKIQNPKFLIFTVVFTLLTVFSPVSFDPSFSKNSTCAADPIKVIEFRNNDISTFTQWVTEDQIKNLSLSDWTKTGAEKFVDPSTISTDGVWQAPAGDGYIVRLAKAVAGYIINSILAVIYLVLWVVYSITYGLTLLSEKILEIVLDPLFVSKEGYLGGFTTKEFVRSTAQLLANLCNMLYLFVLIYIAIKAMFGSSNTRSLLTKLVIAALLTNFGLVLAGIVIDFSQVAMYTVWNGIKGSSNSFAPGTKILDELQKGFGVGRSVSAIDSLFGQAIAFLSMTVAQALTEIIKISGLIVMSLALTVTLISITVILMVRIVALWVLLILTPVAFLFSILPQTEKYWDDWVETLTKYAFTGPILIFFLWLGLKLSASVTSASKLNDIGKNIPNNGDFKYLFFGLVAKNMTVLFEMFTIVITIWAGIIIANKFGIKGAKSIDGLIKSTAGLGKGLADYIPWYSGRASSLLSSTINGITNRRAQKLSVQAELARSEGDTGKADVLDKRAAKWTGAGKWTAKQKDRAVKAFSVMNPLIVKKQFASWWNERTKSHMDQSEASVDEFGRDMVRFVTRGKSFEGEKAEIATEAKINDVNKTFKEKYEKLEKTRAEVANANANVIAVKSIEQPVITRKTLDIQTLEGQIVNSETRLDSLRQDLKHPIGLPHGVTPDTIRAAIKKEEEDKRNLEIEKLKLEKAVEEGEERIKVQEDKKKAFEEQRTSAKRELGALGSTLAEMSTTDEKEKADIEKRSRVLVSRMRGPLPTGYSFSNTLDSTLGYTGNQRITEKAKELAKKNTIDFMTEHIWQKEKFEKSVKEKLKEVEEKYTDDQVEDLVKSGYGDNIMRTALFRKLSSMPRNFGNLLEKTVKNYNGDQKKAMEFLKQRFSEPELTKAFKAADVEARKSNNMFPMGYVIHDPIIGKTRLTRGNERPRILGDFAKGMTPDNINNINPQTFKSDEGLQQLAQNIDWEKLARNPRFIDSMSQKTRILFKNNQARIEPHMSAKNTEAFRKILKV